MGSQPNANSFIPVDPFKPSIGFSIKNIWQGRRRAANNVANDIYSRPVAPPSIINRVPVAFFPPSYRRSSALSSIPHSISATYSSINSHAATPQLHSESLDEEACDLSASAVPPLNDSARLQDSIPEPASTAPTHDFIPESASAAPPLSVEGHSTTTYVLAFILDTIPRQVYLYLLLRLPYMYFSRVTRIFEEAEMSMPQIKKGILETAIQMKDPLPKPRHLLRAMEQTPFRNLQNTWQAFIDSLVREWKTLNIISVLLLSAILTILQIESASKDPLTRFSALISMICALMSLLYGCIYIIRFGTMRKSYKAAEWANEAQKTTQSITWNIWVLLAMPATWLAWSIILFIVCIMSFVWRTGTVEDDSEGPISRDQVRVARIVVTLVLSLGLVYLVLMITTLRRYGEMMDRAWHQRILGWVNDTSAENAQHAPTAGPPVTFSPGSPTGRRARGLPVSIASTTNPILPDRPERHAQQTDISTTQSKTITLVDAATPTAVSSSGFESKSLPQEEHCEQLLHHTEAKESDKRPELLLCIDMLELYHLSAFPGDSIDTKSENILNSNDKVWERLKPDVWSTFEAALPLSWDVHSPGRILPILDKFNTTYADKIGGQLALCQKFQSDGSKYAIFFFSVTGPLPQDQHRYDTIPSDLIFLDIWLSPSSSQNPEMSTEITKISLPSKPSINIQNTSIILSVAQPGIELPSEATNESIGGTTLPES